MAGTLKKAVVAQFLAAVKSSLSHLSELKMVLSDEGSVQSGVSEKDVLQLYSRVRRLREALRRWMSTYPEPATLGLEDDDLNLLCSCLVYELGFADKRAEQQGLSADDSKIWLRRHTETLTAWIVDLSTQPIEQLPSRWRKTGVSYEVRQVLVAVRDKHKQTRPGDDPSGIYRLGSASLNVSANTESPRIEDDVPVGLQTTPPAQAVRFEDVSRSSPLVDSSRIKDYRLRLTMAMDVRAYHRCINAEDHRLALVILGMVLEGCVLDYALVRTAELGLEGSPSTWQIHLIVAHVLEEGFGQAERNALQMIEASTRALRPVSHLENPFVVNKAAVQSVEAFVKKVTNAMGLTSNGPDASASGGKPTERVDPVL